ncbi:juvenile hormone esterase-like isoform X1 [Rhopalosiphum padi]|uniref:juvenile hormone esterase-like isoform X1 n=2 Tax=Rhopalosiphum padi TaxID=40932 RepID=UPI00298D8D46|nr:juvenile hormone esterase-like isoform X1 [Rhopalosiphum padi]
MFSLKMWAVSITCILFLSAVICNPVVRIKNGAIKGQNLKSRNGRDFYSFTAIPYAKPPIDELRFKPPEKVDSWESILDATKESNMCTQNNHFFSSIRHLTFGKEDCLYLNVYTPNVNGKLPVMFWIHGGGFLAGHSGSNVYGPEYFMDKDVVFVSINYRLGLFGFISTEDDVIPGNYGLKDQVMALRWVQENIANFGGDPSQVTIFGESAGGASTGYHLLSPMSKGLFHKAILQSGTPMCRWAVSPPGLIRKRTEAVATIAGCHFNTSEEILSCLKQLPANYIVELHNKFIEWVNHPCIIFPPVVESCDLNQESFLCNHPFTDFKQESFVPTIIGLNSDEGGVFAASLFNETSLQYPELSTDSNRLLPILLMYKHMSLPKHMDEINNRIIEKYFPSGKIESDSHLDAVKMIGDGSFITCTMDMSIKLTSPVYFYLFVYQNEFSFNQFYGDCKKSLGVSHADELISLFSLKELNPKGLGDKDIEMSKLMVNIWVKFASSKIPTIDGTDNGKAWPEFTSIGESVLLHIDSVQPKVIKNPLEKEYKFWSELPLLSRLNKFISPINSNIKDEF